MPARRPVCSVRSTSSWAHDERANDADHAKYHYTWRENHDGRGYYRQGLWVTF